MLFHNLHKALFVVGGNIKRNRTNRQNSNKNENNYSCLFITYTNNAACLCSKKLPILKTNQTLISITEGNSDHKDAWTISPEVKLDVFVSNPFVGTKKITFYSDIDSISFTVKPNKKYDFIILLNGKDKAYTQISTDSKQIPSLESKLFYTRIKNTNQVTDTIPFTIGKDNRIYLKGKVNNSDSLDFLFDTGANSCVITSSLINKKVAVNIDGSQENGSTDGNALVKKSSKNIINIGNLLWNDVPLLSIDYTNRPFDLVLGWVAFEDKIIEINYDKNILIIHPNLPLVNWEYSKLQIDFLDRGVPHINCKIILDGKESNAWYTFDSGSNAELIVGQKFAQTNLLYNSLKVVGKTTSVGSTGNKIVNDKVIVPKLRIGDYEMYQIPMSIKQKDPEGVVHHENIGNNILKRFNVIIDMKNKFIYLKPNRLFYSPM